MLGSYSFTAMILGSREELLDLGLEALCTARPCTAAQGLTAHESEGKYSTERQLLPQTAKPATTSCRAGGLVAAPA